MAHELFNGTEHVLTVEQSVGLLFVPPGGRLRVDRTLLTERYSRQVRFYEVADDPVVVPVVPHGTVESTDGLAWLHLDTASGYRTLNVNDLAAALLSRYTPPSQSQLDFSNPDNIIYTGG